MKLTLTLLVFMITSQVANSQNTNDDTIFQFTVKNIEGEDFDFSSLKGKKIMVVNTASKCGLTPQYKKLQALYDKYGKEDFVIIGFPANNFLRQEPGSDEEIAVFCERNYGVTFPMMSKISVKGKNMHPVYEFLTQEAKNGIVSSSVSWNFQKYLINPDGRLARVVSPRTQPDDPSVISWIESNEE
ncbi:MAG: glutathione peroxidase [Flavobacteriaceae bacterium]|jgi:glutathione peroxidase|nr:glutathione peroxidase [Flavobacteriaceae bacterium]MDG2387643.1 glutathione peroxidase [Flavobacteriaceae bacterium]